MREIIGLQLVGQPSNKQTSTSSRNLILQHHGVAQRDKSEKFLITKNDRATSLHTLVP